MLFGNMHRVREKMKINGRENTKPYQLDSLSTNADSLETRTAQAVDGQSGLVDGNATLQANVARKVGGVQTGANDISENALVNLLGGDLGVSNSGLGTVNGKISSGQVLKTATKRTKRGTLSSDNKHSLLSNRHLLGL